jgi:hypothetical protein
MTITSITPSRGNWTSLTAVLIVGTSFPVTIDSISVNGNLASSVLRVSATLLSATFPESEGVTGDVTVAVTAGIETALSTFTYYGGQWKVKRVDLKQRAEQSN